MAAACDTEVFGSSDSLLCEVKYTWLAAWPDERWLHLLQQTGGGMKTAASDS
jgi:hypothetical protein